LPFRLVAQDGRARRGELATAHGRVETPAFMPVGTLGAVKGLGPEDLERLGASILLCNLYHLALRPGIDAIARLGGLHAFTGWRGPLLTDSGGFQVFSLGHRRQLDEDGVTFRSHLDGSPLRFTPAGVIAMQLALRVDIAMVLDECAPYPVALAGAAVAARRTGIWAARAREAWSAAAPGDGRMLFGIVQGSVYRELRERAAAELAGLDFDGYAIGGVSVGEPLAERRAVVEWTAPLLPETKPRYLMGVGTPLDLVHAVGQGVDLFDCVLPARNGRHGLLFTRQGVLRLKNAALREDPRPPDADCACPVCRRLSRAFLHHLVRAGELTGAVLATVHNLAFYLDLMRDLREAIASRRLAELAATVAHRYSDTTSLEEAEAEPRLGEACAPLPGAGAGDRAETRSPE
jgi:queuine tRNA-ribosyltransferase